MQTYVVFTNTLPVLVITSSEQEAKSIASESYTVVGVVKQ